MAGTASRSTHSLAGTAERRSRWAWRSITVRSRPESCRFRTAPTAEAPCQSQSFHPPVTWPAGCARRGRHVAGAAADVEESGTIVTRSPDRVVPDDLQGKEYAFLSYPSYTGSARKAPPMRKTGRSRHGLPRRLTKNGPKADGCPRVLFMTGSSPGAYGRFS